MAPTLTRKLLAALSRHPYFFSFVLLSSAVTALGLCYYFNLRDQLFRSFIPPKIKLAETLFISGQDSLLGGCGVASFRVAPETLALIKKEGLEFFHDAVIVRQKVSNDKSSHLSYRTINYQLWQQMPLADKFFSEGLFSGFGCADQMSDSEKKVINAEARSNRGYHTQSSDGSYLWLLYNLGVVVYIYRD